MAPAPANVPRTALVLSWLVAAGALVSSVTGSVRRSVYRDPETFIAAGWIGNDLVVAALFVPTLAIATWSAGRGSRVGTLVWLGALDAMLYNYAFYLFGAAPNRLLVLYVVIVALCLFALVVALLALEVTGSPPLPKGTRRFLIIYQGLWAASLAALWLGRLVAFAWTGDTPDLNGSPKAFAVTAGLDLVFVVPWVAAAALLVSRRSAWALAASAILNVKGVLYPAVLIASSITASQAGVDGALTLVPLWIAFLVTSAVACSLLLRRSP